jgi:hypothetical protein
MLHGQSASTITPSTPSRRAIRNCTNEFEKERFKFEQSGKAAAQAGAADPGDQSHRRRGSNESPAGLEQRRSTGTEGSPDKAAAAGSSSSSREGAAMRLGIVQTIKLDRPNSRLILTVAYHPRRETDRQVVEIFGSEADLFERYDRLIDEDYSQRYGSPV